MPSVPLDVRERPGGASYLQTPIPVGCTLSIASDTNSTISRIQGAGRMVGDLLASAGRRVDRIIDKFAEQQLGQGPNVTALKLCAALHDQHVVSRQASVTGMRMNAADKVGLCVSDYWYPKGSRISFVDVAERLIWACNGYCSQCMKPYLSSVLQNPLPDAISKILKSLVAHVCSSSPLPNITLAATFIRLLAESQIFCLSVFENLEILASLELCFDHLTPMLWAIDPQPDVVIALQDAMEAVKYCPVMTCHLNSLRFSPQVIADSEISGVWSQFQRTTSGHDMMNWIKTHVNIAQFLTYLCLTLDAKVDICTQALARQLFEEVNTFKMSLDVSKFIMDQAAYIQLLALGLLIGAQPGMLIPTKQDMLCAIVSRDGNKITSLSSDYTMQHWDPIRSVEESQGGYYFELHSPPPPITPKATIQINPFSPIILGTTVSIGGRAPWGMKAFLGLGPCVAQDLQSSYVEPDQISIPTLHSYACKPLELSARSQTLSAAPIGFRADSRFRLVKRFALTSAGSRPAPPGETGIQPLVRMVPVEQEEAIIHHNTMFSSKEVETTAAISTPRLLLALTHGISTFGYIDTVTTIKMSHHNRTMRMKCSRDSTYVYIGEQQIHLWQRRPIDPSRSVEPNAGADQTLMISISMHPFSAYMVPVLVVNAICVVPEMEVRDENPKGTTAPFGGHMDWVTSVAYSPNGLYIASGSRDCTIRVWDVKTGRQLVIIRGHSGSIASVVFSPDGVHIISCSQDRTVRMWDIGIVL